MAGSVLLFSRACRESGTRAIQWQTSGNAGAQGREARTGGFVFTTERRLSQPLAFSRCYASHVHLIDDCFDLILRTDRPTPPHSFIDRQTDRLSHAFARRFGLPASASFQLVRRSKVRTFTFSLACRTVGAREAEGRAALEAGSYHVPGSAFACFASRRARGSRCTVGTARRLRLLLTKQVKVAAK